MSELRSLGGLLLLGLLLAGCRKAPVPDPSQAADVLPCAELTTAQDEDCSRQACQACVDFCGNLCQPLEESESFSCPGVGSFSPSEFCPSSEEETLEASAPEGEETEEPAEEPGGLPGDQASTPSQESALGPDSGPGLPDE